MAILAVSLHPSSVVIFDFLFEEANAAVLKPSEVPISKILSGLKYYIKLINNLALLFEIPACLAIFETFLLLDEKTLEPAPKSVTSSIEVFNESSFL